MPQGASKLATKPSGKRNNKTQNPKKGQRTIAPKRHSLVRAAAQKKQLSAKITRSIEQQTVAVASSGKLTILKNVAMES